MNLSSSEWMIVILLVIGSAVLVIGLLGRIRWRLVVVGGMLTIVAVYLLVQTVMDARDTAPSPTLPPSPVATPITSPGTPSPTSAP